MAEHDGFHVCLRTSSAESVDLFYAKALELGASDAGKPGYREHYAKNYYAAFVLDQDNNRLEVVTFVRD